MTTLNATTMLQDFFDRVDAVEEFDSHDKANIARMPSISCPVDEFINGYLSLKNRKGYEGASIVMPDRIGAVPIKIPDDTQKFIVSEQQPMPMRNAQPIYENIYTAGQFYDGETMDHYVNMFELYAQVNDVDFAEITPENFYIDFFPSDYMTSPAVASFETSEGANVKEVLSSVAEEQVSRELVTITCDYTKGLPRYAPHFDKITVFFFEDYPMTDFDKYKGFSEDVNPKIEIVFHSIKATLEQYLAVTDSATFIETFNLNPESSFSSNYLPQAFKLGDLFFESFSLYLDDEGIENATAVELPVKAESSALDELNLTRKFRSFIQDRNTSYDSSIILYDKDKHEAATFFDHRFFRDKVVSKGDRMTFGALSLWLDDYLESDIRTCCYKLHIKKGDASFNPMDYCTSWIDQTLDITLIHEGHSVLYFPMTEIQLGRVNEMGTILLNGKKYRLPPAKDLLLCQFDGHDYVLDFIHTSKTFFKRRMLIPEELRVPYSHSLVWSNSYVVYPYSALPVDTFGARRATQASILYEVFSGLSSKLLGQQAIQENCEPKLRERTIKGLGWNSEIRKFVFDVNATVQISPVKLEDRTQFCKNYRFDKTNIHTAKALHLQYAKFFSSESNTVVPYSKLAEYLKVMYNELGLAYDADLMSCWSFYT